jgi:hypothetical protein
MCEGFFIMIGGFLCGEMRFIMCIVCGSFFEVEILGCLGVIISYGGFRNRVLLLLVSI